MGKGDKDVKGQRKHGDSDKQSKGRESKASESKHGKQSRKDSAAAVIDALRVGPGFDFDAFDPAATPGARNEAKALDEFEADAEELAELQERLFAASKGGDQRRVLLIVQGMDTAGKGGIVRHVVGQVDPQGVQITAFKAPTPEELEHDFLWRIERGVPGPGMIGVFDRSQYEDVLIGRVRELAPAAEIERRYGAINDFEARLAAEGVTVVKCALLISLDEQKARLAERLERPDKHWKYNPGDLAERALWPAYREAYEVMFERTSTEVAPWYAIPANEKWYARFAVQQLLLEALRGIDPQWPAADFDVAEQQRLLAES